MPKREMTVQPYPWRDWELRWAIVPNCDLSLFPQESLIAERRGFSDSPEFIR